MGLVSNWLMAMLCCPVVVQARGTSRAPVVAAQQVLLTTDGAGGYA